MEPLCPECLVPLELAGDSTARCAKHGGEFQILFARTPLQSPVAAEAPPAIQAVPVCAWHPSKPASYICKSCGASICDACASRQWDGSRCCPNCTPRLTLATPPVMNPAATAPADVRCVQHANLPARAKCNGCGAFMCQTCTFDLPGGLRICPECATKAPTINSTQKRLLIGAFVAAVWCTIASTAYYGGTLRGLAQDRESMIMLGYLVMALLPLPSLIGIALSLSSMERRSPTSMAMWIATAWNGVILAAFLLFFFKNLLSGATR
jgi:hypothetical protein